MGRRTPAVATGQCAGTTLARVVRGSAKAGAEMQTARILNVSPPMWTYKSCALFALQSIYLKSECGFGVPAFRSLKAVVCKICSASILYGLSSILYRTYYADVGRVIALGHM